MVLKIRQIDQEKKCDFKKHYNRDKKVVCLSIFPYWQVCTLSPVLNRGRLFELLKCIDGYLFLPECLIPLFPSILTIIPGVP